MQIKYNSILLAWGDTEHSHGPAFLAETNSMLACLIVRVALYTHKPGAGDHEQLELAVGHTP